MNTTHDWLPKNHEALFNPCKHGITSAAQWGVLVRRALRKHLRRKRPVERDTKRDNTVMRCSICDMRQKQIVGAQNFAPLCTYCKQ
jgi:hypothetical protein